MKFKLTTSLVSFVVAVIFVGCTCTPPKSSSVTNTLRSQETYNWCWAATTQMLAQHVGQTVTQCDLANHRLSKTNCCDYQNAGQPCPKTNNCNTPGWPELDYSGVKSNESSTALSWANLKNQIYCSKKPMGFAYGTSGVVGHVVVIIGYQTIDGINYVVLNDPWTRCNGQVRSITYAEYVNPSGSATHWNTWYNIEKK